MAVDMFLQINGIKGESEDDAYKDEIDVLSWSWGMSQSGTMHLGGGGGAGKVSVQDLSFTKYMDKASAPLMLACCTGKHIPNATLVCRKAGENPVEYLKLTMTDVLVSSYQTGGSGGQERLTENVTLNFKEYEEEYVPQKADGSPDTPARAGFNIARNVKTAG